MSEEEDDFEFEEEDLELPEIEEEEEEEEMEEEIPPPPPEQILSPEEIPLTVTVEVGKVEMSAKEALELGPGNVVELGTPVGKSVSLVVNGKCVGRGELIKMGEVLGVRVLEL